MSLFFRVFVKITKFLFYLYGLMFPEWPKRTTGLRFLAEMCMCFFGFGSVFIFPYYSLKYVMMDSRSYYNQSTVLRYTEILYAVSLATCNIIIMVSAWIRKASLRRLTQEIENQINIMDGQLGNLRAEKFIIMLAFVISFFIDISLIPLTIIDYFAFYENIFGKYNPLNYLLLFSYAWNNFVTSFPCLLYVVYGMVFKLRLKNINKKLTNAFTISRECNKQNLSSKVDKEDSENKIFNRLLREIKMGRNDYERFVNTVSILMFAHGSYRFYYWISVIFFGLLQDGSIMILFVFVGALVMASFYLVGNLADSIQTEAYEPTKIAAKVHQDISDIIDKNSCFVSLNTLQSLQTKIKLLRLYTKRPLEASILGLYNLSRSNIISLIPTSLSFMVIFLQFHISEITTTLAGANAKT